MKYEVRVINPEGPGRKLFTGSLDACRDHIAESGCAYDYSLGVAVRRVEDDHYDCGFDGEFRPAAECWD